MRWPWSAPECPEPVAPVMLPSLAEQHIKRWEEDEKFHKTSPVHPGDTVRPKFLLNAPIMHFRWWEVRNAVCCWFAVGTCEFQQQAFRVDELEYAQP